MRRLLVVCVAAVAAVLVVTALPIGANQERGIKATLTGFEEVPTASTGAAGSFTAKIEPGDEAVTWTLSYSGLEGSATQAHIHIGAPRTNGGVSVWLCSNLPSSPPGVPACPVTGGTVSGVIDADDVVGPGAQGIAAGEYGELLRAIRSGVAYANVHSSKFPGGEIRGQLQ